MMIEFFKKWCIVLLMAMIAVTMACAKVEEVTFFQSIMCGLFTPFVIFFFYDNYKEKQERKRFEEKLQLCTKPYNEIMFFTYNLANQYSFGTDLEPPQNVNDLFGGYNIAVATGFEMRLRFLTVGRVPIPANMWKQKAAIFQTDFDWGIQNGNLASAIKVKRFCYSDNAAWLDIEVIP